MTRREKRSNQHETQSKRFSRRTVLKTLGAGAFALPSVAGGASAAQRSLVFSDDFDYEDSPFNHGWSEDAAGANLEGCENVETANSILTLNGGSYDHCRLYRDLSLGAAEPVRAQTRARHVKTLAGGEGRISVLLNADNQLKGSSTQIARVLFQNQSPKNVLRVQNGDQRTEVTADQVGTSDWRNITLWYNGERTFAGTASNPRMLVADISPPLSQSVRAFLQTGAEISEFDNYKVYRGQLR